MNGDSSPANGAPGSANGAPGSKVTARSTKFERSVLKRALQITGAPKVTVRLWDGATAGDGGAAAATLTVHGRAALWRLLARGDIAFGDLYSDGGIAVDGDLTQFLCEMFTATARARRENRWLDTAIRIFTPRPRLNTTTGSRRNIRHHYDIGNDFYRLWLDERMQYTCAYYPDQTFTVEQAQRAKMDHVCKKLQLKPGDTVVEAGCGWGSLAFYMAQNYGASVTAYNISAEQVSYARARAREAGLEDKLNYVEDDYRNISGEFDAFVSVGMLEHVGRAQYKTLGDVVAQCLRRGGRGLVHTIGRNRPRLMSPWIEKRIFPGAYPPTLREMMDIFEGRDFSVLDVENLRLHYARTLQHWRERYEAALPRVREMFDEEFARAWHLYLCGSQAAFLSGSLQLFQVVFAHGDDNGVPWTRGHLYR